jgi:hypothetical protein
MPRERFETQNVPVPLSRQPEIGNRDPHVGETVIADDVTPAELRDALGLCGIEVRA